MTAINAFKFARLISVPLLLFEVMDVEGLRALYSDEEALIECVRRYALNTKWEREKIMDSSIDFERNKVLNQYEKVLSV